MGCFNVKCGLTGMDIVHGDRIVLLFGIRIHKQNDCGGYRYQPHEFQLMATPIFGEYNDYGWIEDVEPTSWKVAMGCLEAFDPEGGWVGADTEDSDKFFKKFRGPSWKPSTQTDQPVMTYVHRSAWDGLIKATDKKTMQHDFVTMDSTGCFTGQEIQAEMQRLKVWSKDRHNTLDDTRATYEGTLTHWLSIDGNTTQRFALADWIEERCDMTFLADTEESAMQKVREEVKDLPKDQQDSWVERARFRLYMSDFAQDSSQAKYYPIQTKLGWFAPFFYRDRAERRFLMGPILHRLLTLQKGEAERGLFKNAAAAYAGLCAARLVIRAESDMHSSGQGIDAAPEAATKAIATAMLKISDKRIAEMEEW